MPCFKVGCRWGEGAALPVRLYTNIHFEPCSAQIAMPRVSSRRGERVALLFMAARP